MRILLTLCFVFTLFFNSYATAKTVEAYGEAEIKDNDISTAKLQAIARAKWDAMEKAAKIKVKVETLVQNAILIDEAVKSEIGAVIKSYKIIDEGKDGNVYWNKILAEVVPEKANKAINYLSKNTSVAVLIPVVFPDKHVEETSSLSEYIIQELINKNLEVVDLGSTGNSIAIRDIDTAMKNNDFIMLRNLASKYLSAMLLIGKVETDATVTEGRNVGYGVTMPFNIVTGRLTYRLIGEKDGRKIILASGYVSARGQGTNLNDATYRMMDNLKESVSERLIGIVMEKIKGINNKPIEIILAGNNDMDEILKLKNRLNYIAWVLNTEVKGTDKILVTYPEKTLYLVAAIKSKQKYEIKEFNDYQIILKPYY
jgi:hypothetical protein